MFPSMFPSRWSHLTPRQQTVLVALFVDNCSLADLATRLGVSIPAARHRYQLCKLALGLTPQTDEYLVAVRQLPRRERAVVFFTIFPLLTLNEIAVRMGLPVTLVNTLHTRGMRKLAVRFPQL